MNIGLMGPGEKLVQVNCQKLRDAGYPVKMANSKGARLTQKLAAETEEQCFIRKRGRFKMSNVIFMSS